MTRTEILGTAAKLVSGEREQQYGSPEDNFGMVAKYWSAYLGYDICAEDIAVMMILLKVARLCTGTGSPDTWVDIAGYAALGGELQSREEGRG